MFKVPGGYRSKFPKNHHLYSDATYGNNGAFTIPLSIRSTAFCIASDGLGWEHVSVHIISDGKERTPTWSEMCKVKEFFWDEEDWVAQYHPARSEYVNQHKHTLHLWRCPDQEFPKPLSIMVGMK